MRAGLFIELPAYEQWLMWLVCMAAWPVVTTAAVLHSPADAGDTFLVAFAGWLAVWAAVHALGPHLHARLTGRPSPRDDESWVVKAVWRAGATTKEYVAREALPFGTAFGLSMVQLNNHATLWTLPPGETLLGVGMYVVGWMVAAPAMRGAALRRAARAGRRRRIRRRLRLPAPRQAG